MSSCPYCESREGFVKKVEVVGHDGGEELVRESARCKSCRRSIEVRSGPRERFKLEDDIARLERTLRHTGSESIRRLLDRRRTRLRQRYGESD